MEVLTPVCARKQDLPPSNGAWSCVTASGAGDGSVEMQVALPILSVVSCFSICRF
jgi:hypothetical protein